MCIFQLLTSEYLISLLKLSLKWLFYLPKCWFNRPNPRFGSSVKAPIFEKWVLTWKYMLQSLCCCSVQSSLQSIHCGNSYTKTWGTVHNVLDAATHPDFVFGFCLVLFECLGIFVNLFIEKHYSLGFWGVFFFNFNCSFIIKTLFPEL